MTRVVSPCRRRGAVLPLTAILLIGLLGMVAIAIDTGYICWTEAELQNAADSAALAGASRLLVPLVPGTSGKDTVSQNAVNQATAEAELFAGYHRAGGVTLTLPAQDVVVGSPASRGSGTVTPWSAGKSFPNTVQVTTRRSSGTNGSLPLTFGQVLGIPSWSGSATAKATCSAGVSTVTGFSGSPSAPLPPLLPIAISNTYWNTFLSSAKSPDGTVHDSYTATAPTTRVAAPHNVTSGADGIPEFYGVFPTVGSTGHCRLIGLRNSSPGLDYSSYNDWILHGPTAADLKSFGVSGLQATTSAPGKMYGGLEPTTATVANLYLIIGQPRIVPLFSSVTGTNGSMTYTVVGFAGVTVVSTTIANGARTVTLQPLIVVNPNATTQAGDGHGSTFIYTSAPIALSN